MTMPIIQPNKTANLKTATDNMVTVLQQNTTCFNSAFHNNDINNNYKYLNICIKSLLIN